MGGGKGRKGKGEGNFGAQRGVTEKKRKRKERARTSFSIFGGVMGYFVGSVEGALQKKQEQCAEGVAKI